MDLCKIHPFISRFIQSNMSKWKTNMTLVHKQCALETEPISIKRGLFQGDSLYSLLFTMFVTQSIQYRTPKDSLRLPAWWASQDEPPVLFRWVQAVWNNWQPTEWYQMTSRWSLVLTTVIKATFQRGKKISREGI